MIQNDKDNQRVTLLASLGSILEYYDFIIYGMMATYLSSVFFPPQNPSSAVLQAFLVFAVGYFSRPLGGTLIGILGDRFGRRPAFLISTSLMALSTLTIALLPSYATFGEIAVFGLVCCRIVQGLSFGGELAGAMTIVGEFSPNHRKSRGASFVLASTSIGALLANGMLYALAASMSQADIISWGWRLPFLCGGLLGIILLIARNTIRETPAFEAIQAKSKQSQPFRTVLTTHKLSLLRGAFLTTFMGALVMVNLFFPYYIPKYFGYSIASVYFASTIALIFSVFILPLTGMLIDRFGQKSSWVRFACLQFILLGVPSYALLKIGTMASLLSFMFLQQIFLAFFTTSFFPILSRLFAPEVRYTGFALCYNTSWAAMATIPMGFTALLGIFETPWCIPVAVGGFAVLSALATIGMKEKEVIQNSTDIIEETPLLRRSMR